MNLIDQVWLAKLYYQTGMFSKAEYVRALNHLFDKAMGRTSDEN